MAHQPRGTPLLIKPPTGGCLQVYYEERWLHSCSPSPQDGSHRRPRRWAAAGALLQAGPGPFVLQGPPTPHQAHVPQYDRWAKLPGASQLQHPCSQRTQCWERPRESPFHPSSGIPAAPLRGMVAVVTQLQTGEGGSLLASHSQEQQVWGCGSRLLLAEDQLRGGGWPWRE